MSISSGCDGLLLQCSALTLVRGERQLFSGLDLSLRPGEVLQIEGENGAGKTSLLRVLAGLARYGYEGEINRSVPLLYIGHLSAVKELLTPRENLAWHVDGHADHRDADVCAALAKVGLAGYEDLPSHQLSAGQHRRVNLARLHLSQQPLWLLDEPFTAIDRDGVASLEELFVSHASRGGAVVLTSHQPLRMEYPLTRLMLRPGGEP